MLRSTFSGFNMAYLALTASQRALDVTGQNISNVNTAGYTRQRLDLSSISPVGASVSCSQYDTKVGQGVQMRGVTQVRDPFLDVQYRNQLPKVGTVDAEDMVLKDIGQIFDETDKDAIAVQLNDVITQLKNLANPENTGSSGADAVVRSSCEVFFNMLHENAAAIEDVYTEMVSKMDQTVMADINGYIEDIVNLNRSIKNSQILGSPALELQDTRNEKIDALATYFPIEVKKETKNVGGGIKVDVVNINLRLSDGTRIALVADEKKGSVEVAKETVDGKETVKEPVQFVVTDVEGQKHGEDETDPLIDHISEGVVKGDLNMINKSEVYDKFGPNGAATDTRGIQYYMKTLDVFAQQFVNVLNELNGAVKMEEDGTVTVLDASKALFTTDDGQLTGITASNVKVSDRWMQGDTRIQTEADPGEEHNSSDNLNVQRMIDALSNKAHDYRYTDEAGTTYDDKIFTGTLYEFYTNIQAVQAIDRKASSTILDNHTTVLNDIADSKDSVSGVYMDEEVMNLMKYSQSYNAASRLMTSLDEIIDKLINGTGVVGR